MSRVEIAALFVLYLLLMVVVVYVGTMPMTGAFVIVVAHALFFLGRASASMREDD